MVNEREVWIQEVDAALKEWHQGDCVLGEHWFVFRFNPQRPLTPDSADVAREETDLSESEVKGFVVVSQTCDIVRSCASRPFAEVVPLVEINEQFLGEIKISRKQFLDEVAKGRRLQFAYIPGVAQFYLVADLDRVMTVEKAVIVEWKRIAGCRNDEEIGALGKALSRKRSRFAFPDDFNRFVQKLQKQMRDKHEKSTTEGEALRALREIRICAKPSWEDPKIQLMFWFIRNEEQVDFKNLSWNQFLKQWLALIPTSERFQSVDGLVVSLEDMTAKDYVESNPLDLDHLSSNLKD